VSRSWQSQVGGPQPTPAPAAPGPPPARASHTEIPQFEVPQPGVPRLAGPRRGPAHAGRVVRFVALGDSLTEGLGDPSPDPAATGGPWRGWARLLADGLAPASAAGRVEFRNLAASGALTRDLIERQLAEACAFGPDLAAVVVGGNDTLRAHFDIAAVAARLDLALSTLAASGAVPLTACLPAPGRMLRLPEALARPLARRMRSVNAVVHALSDRYGAVHVHLAGMPWADRPEMWSVDRLHPAERGHRAIARAFHRALTARELACGPEPADALDGPPPTRGGSVRWMATKGTRWVAARSRDLLPDLLRLAAAERRHRARGATGLLDARAAHETAAVLAALGAVPGRVPVPTGPPGAHAV